MEALLPRKNGRKLPCERQDPVATRVGATGNLRKRSFELPDDTAEPEGIMRYPTQRFSERSVPTVENERNASQVFYHPELDVLRFLAFLAVFFHHALPRDAALYIRNGLPPAASQFILAAKEAGGYGVDLFFVLSAYLITELLIREHAQRGSFSISAFYVRRALRIWPLYFTFLALTIFVVPTILPADQFGTIYIVSFLLFFGNWVSAANGLPFSVASPLWSVSVEEQFYLIWPPLLRLVGIQRIKHLAIGMLVVALSTRAVMAAYAIEHPAVWCNTVARLDSIALGAILAVALRGRAPQMKTVFRVLLSGAAVATFLLVAKFLHQDGPTSVITYTATALASVMLLLAVLHKDAQFLRLPSFSWLVYLGRISYGLYVVHLLALALVPEILIVNLGIPIGYELRVLLSFALTVLLAAASYRWLEQPFLRLKERFSKIPTGEHRPRWRPRFPAPLIATTKHLTPSVNNNPHVSDL
jgi:peptidoglycan/LPS O-acetylase OafA/YrhL